MSKKYENFSWNDFTSSEGARRTKINTDKMNERLKILEAILVDGVDIDTSFLVFGDGTFLNSQQTKAETLISNDTTPIKNNVSDLITTTNNMSVNITNLEDSVELIELDIIDIENEINTITNTLPLKADISYVDNEIDNLEVKVDDNSNNINSLLNLVEASFTDNGRYFGITVGSYPIGTTQFTFNPTSNIVDPKYLIFSPNLKEITIMKNLKMLISAYIDIANNTGNNSSFTLNIKKNNSIVDTISVNVPSQKTFSRAFTSIPLNSSTNDTYVCEMVVSGAALTITTPTQFYIDIKETGLNLETVRSSQVLDDSVLNSSGINGKLKNIQKNEEAIIQLKNSKADKNKVYSIVDSDALLFKKADKANSYTKSQIDAKFAELKNLYELPIGTLLISDGTNLPQYGTWTFVDEILDNQTIKGGTSGNGSVGDHSHNVGVYANERTIEDGNQLLRVRITNSYNSTGENISLENEGTNDTFTSKILYNNGTSPNIAYGVGIGLGNKIYRRTA